MTEDRQGRTPQDWCGPGSPAVIALLDNAAKGSSAKGSSSVAASGGGPYSTAGQLPPGWIKCWNEEYQQFYFQNNQTQVTTWEDPRGDMAQELLQRDIDRIAAEKAAERAGRGWQRRKAAPELGAEGLPVRT